ncbi:patatin-like phospholipase family protein [Trueperella bialowiezensis]|uniref:NTE family protein rssA n=1 Tax=Trueperella bialowiezensis TaxID=312285 RepID=A0A448PDF9_9ACTO|nr:patatin-like phospholipase family protein [Trueperella bialowiezensis]VEI12964.1 NTE family protein rssA [Trueperella bialowiezensis]
MKIALVLGSGGARGWAHIGVLDELEARGHEVVAISGASIGSLVGGVYGAGKLAELKEWVLGLSKSDVRSLLDFTIGEPGLIKGKRVLAEIEKVTGSPDIEDLRVPFTAVAVDIISGREVWFQRGPLFRAVRASISIPTAFTPVRIGNRLLVDGGLLNPLPVEPTLSVAADATVAVDLRGPAATHPREVLSRDDLKLGAEGEDSWMTKSWERAKRSLLETEFFHRLEESWGARFGDAASASDNTSGSEPLPESLRTMEVMALSLRVMQDAINRYRAAPNPVPATVRIPKDAVGDLDYHRAAELIDMGRTAAIKVFDETGI